MSIEMLKREAAALDEKSQGELLVFLATLREERWVGRLREAAKVLDDPSAKWLTREEVTARLATVPDTEEG